MQNHERLLKFEQNHKRTLHVDLPIKGNINKYIHCKLIDSIDIFVSDSDPNHPLLL